MSEQDRDGPPRRFLAKLAEFFRKVRPVMLRLPARFNAATAKVRIGGKLVTTVAREGTIQFDVTVSQSDGHKQFAVEFVGGQ